MREMKSTNYKWLGDIPVNWTVERNKYLANISIGLVTTMTENYVDNIEDGVYLIRNGNIRTNEIVSDNMVYLSMEFAKLNEHRKLHKGNIVTVHTGDVGTSAIIDDKYDGCMGFATIQTIPNPHKAYNKYLCWFYNSEAFKTQSIEFSTGDGRQNLNLYDFVDFFVPVPPIKEQKEIADFLDKKCSEIDAITKDIQKQIEVLEDYKKSVIAEAVTKGLNPSAEMKESGIQWIGRCPKKWKLIRLKYVSKTRNIKYLPTYGNLDYFALENIVSWKSKFQETDNIYDLSGSNICKKNDVVFGKLRPYLAKTYLVDFDRCCSAEFAIFYDFDGYQKYLLYLVSSKPFVETVDFSTYGTKMPRANINFINNLIIPLPSKIEQKEILSYLETRCEMIDLIIEKKTKQLEILNDYKKSMIYEYVTGKKEVI